MDKTFCLVLLVLLSQNVYLQSSVDSIKVIFLHGSRPVKGESQEIKLAGGLKGGHVVTQIQNNVYGFNFTSKRIRIIPHPWNIKVKIEKVDASAYLRSLEDSKISIITIPMSAQDFNAIQKYYETKLAKVNFDYALFGMRCASTCYKALSLTNVFPKSSNFRAIIKSFYPKQLRKKLCKIATKYGYNVYVKNGRTSRIWEGDK